MSRQEEMNLRVDQMIAALARDFADLGEELRWQLSRTLIHRIVHYATGRPGVEFCALATYLAEMIGHAHGLSHGKNPQAHRDLLH